MNSFHRFT